MGFLAASVSRYLESNLRLEFGEALSFTIGVDGFVWTGKSALTAGDLLAPEGDAETRSEISGAVGYLQEALADGPRPVKQVEAEGGYHPRTLRRAAKKLGIERHREGQGGPWIWSLPVTIGDKETHRGQFSELSSMQEAVPYAPETPEKEAAAMAPSRRADPVIEVEI